VASKNMKPRKPRKKSKAFSKPQNTLLLRRGSRG